MARVSALPSNCRQWLLARATWPTRTAFPADRRSMIGMCEATNPADDELIRVAKSYLSMNDSRIFSSETANDPGTYIFLSARLRMRSVARGGGWIGVRLRAFGASGETAFAVACRAEAHASACSRERRLAERVGFEPTVEFPLHTLSKRAPSTTRTSLRVFRISGLQASG